MSLRTAQGIQILNISFRACKKLFLTAKACWKSSMERLIIPALVNNLAVLSTSGLSTTVGKKKI